jgi:hypothetical protein
MFFWIKRLYLSADYKHFLEIAPMQPTESDRGRFRLYLEADIEIAPDQRGFSRTYFSEANAVQEAESWWLTTLAIRSAGGYPVDEDGLRRSPRIILLPPEWEKEGKQCRVEVLPIEGITINGVDMAIAVGHYAANVVVHPGHELDCFIDDSDTFPRYYFSREVAIEEMTAWMQRRGQI